MFQSVCRLAGDGRIQDVQHILYADLGGCGGRGDGCGQLPQKAEILRKEDSEFLSEEGSDSAHRKVYETTLNQIYRPFVQFLGDHWRSKIDEALRRYGMECVHLRGLPRSEHPMAEGHQLPAVTPEK